MSRTLGPCSVDGCDRIAGVPGSARGMCGRHYQLWQRNGAPVIVRRRNVCTIDGCDGLVEGRGWCQKHYARWKRHGDPAARMPGEVVDGRRVCPRCEQDVPLDEWGKGYCRACVAARMRERRAENPPPLVEKHPATCDACGETFMADGRRWRYCSPECFEAYRHKANWKHVTARRARERAVRVETFDRREVFERDGWMCALCGDPVDPDLAWPDQRSASLDHRIPISRGGEHSRANAQTSHLGCNVRKGARLMEGAA